MLDYFGPPALLLGAVGSNRIKCMATQPHILLHACVIYMSPLLHVNTHLLCPSFPYTPDLRKGMWESQRRNVAGRRGHGAIFDMGHRGRRHKAPFPAPPCGKWQESKMRRRRGRRQKKVEERGGGNEGATISGIC